MNRISLWTIGILAFLILGCTTSFSDTKSDDKELKSGQDQNPGSQKQEFTFRTVYFQSTGDTDFPEVSEQAVSKKFKNITIRLSSDSIYLNDFGLPIEHEEPKTSFFFGRKYEYNYYKSAFHIGYNEELGDKIQVVFADFQGDQSSESWNYFFEGGYAIVKGTNLYLNFKRYIIQYSADPLKKNQVCELPFDMWRAWRFCEYDDRTINCDFCNSEFPLYPLKKDEKLKSSIEKHLDGRTIKNLYKINTKNAGTDLFVVNAEPLEESNGDYFIITRNSKNELAVVKDANNEFLHSYFFTISKSLKVTMYENTGYTPKQKVNSEFQIQADGTYSKL